MIREAAERFCKEAIVKDRRAKGDAAASLNDYDRKNLGQLTPLLNRSSDKRVDNPTFSRFSEPLNFRAFQHNLPEANVPGTGEISKKKGR